MKISWIFPKESGSKRKNDTQQEYFWHLNTQPQGVPEVKKGGLKGGTPLLTPLGKYDNPVTLKHNFDNFRCSHGWKFNQSDISVSVNDYIIYFREIYFNLFKVTIF